MAALLSGGLLPMLLKKLDWRREGHTAQDDEVCVCIYL